MTNEKTVSDYTLNDYLIGFGALIVRTLLTTYLVLKVMTWMGFVLVIGTLPRPVAPPADQAIVARP